MLHQFLCLSVEGFPLLGSRNDLTVLPIAYATALLCDTLTLRVSLRKPGIAGKYIVYSYKNLNVRSRYCRNRKTLGQYSVRYIDTCIVKLYLYLWFVTVIFDFPKW
jgi:hypothetical protein